MLLRAQYVHHGPVSQIYVSSLKLTDWLGRVHVLIVKTFFKLSQAGETGAKCLTWLLANTVLHAVSLPMRTYIIR